MPSFLGLPGPLLAEYASRPNAPPDPPKKEPTLPLNMPAQAPWGEGGSSTPCGGEEVDDVGVDAGPTQKRYLSVTKQKFK